LSSVGWAVSWLWHCCSFQFSTWFGAIAGLAGFSVERGSFYFLPEAANFFLLGALVAYSGAGGATNLTLSNWARDKGYGMGQRSGLHSGSHWRAEGEPRPYGLYLHSRQAIDGTDGAGGGGS
jgi:hypothetical protein